MLDGLLGRGFSAKCKSSIKLTKTRIVVIRRKRNATQKFLKKDIADLLMNGLDINAYGRADGLLTELDLSSCYDFIEQFCMCITKHLSTMQKQRECPEECREAVSSLMFAAARFSELLELRDLRHIFTEKYGKNLEFFVNQEFVEKLAAKPPTTDKKLQLMCDIAQEFSIRWDSRAFEQKMSNPSASEQEQLIRGTNVDGYKLQRGNLDVIPQRDNLDVSSRGRREVTDDGYRLCNGREDTISRRGHQDMATRGRHEITDNGYRPRDYKEDVPKRVNQDVPSHRREVIDDGYEPRSIREDTVRNNCYLDVTSRGRSELGDDGLKPRNGREVMVLKRDNVPSHRRGELTDGYKLCNGREDDPPRRREIADYGNRPYDHREDMILKTENQDIQSHRREVADDGYKPWNIRDNNVRNKDNLNVTPCGRSEFNEYGYRQSDAGQDMVLKRGQDVPSHRRRELADDKPLKGREDPSQNNENLGNFSHGRPELTVDGNKQRNGKEDTVPITDNQDILSHGRLELALSSVTKPPIKIEKEDMHVPGNSINGPAESLKPFCNNFVPPPYVKPNISKFRNNSDSPVNDRDVADSRSEKTLTLSASTNREIAVIEPERVNGHGKEKYHHHQDDLVGDVKLKSRSVRRRHGRKTGDLEDDRNVRSSSCRRREDARRGLQTLLDEELDAKDEEEKMMDRLLIHYSKKRSTFEPGKVKRRSKPPPPPSSRLAIAVAVAGDSPCNNRGRDVLHLNAESRPPPSRALSLPREPTIPTEAAKIPARSSSFKPELLAGHVHPKLPDYDDLAARFAALRRG